MPVEEQVELKVYMTRGLYNQLRDEVSLCGCSMSAVARTAIAKEIVDRRNKRKKDNVSGPLPGQTSFDGSN
jgi:post-segregation antitoxin (ccd killing protein)